ncbi:hypothetical protein [Streptomyces sp. NPDC001770]
MRQQPAGSVVLGSSAPSLEAALGPARDFRPAGFRPALFPARAFRR